jgi:hypothetical protein
MYITWVRLIILKFCTMHNYEVDDYVDLAIGEWYDSWWCGYPVCQENDL